MQFRSIVSSVGVCAVLSACVPIQLPDIAAFLPSGALPAMRWDHRPEAAEWTMASLTAIAGQDARLAATLPADIETWCPGYADAGWANRRAFWSGLLSAVAKYESSWNPQASGGGGQWIGLMQISPATARHYDCSATSSEALKDGSANLQCAVQIMAAQVGRDGVVAGKGRQGIGRDWAPLHASANRAEMSAWTRQQSYCKS